MISCVKETSTESSSSFRPNYLLRRSSSSNAPSQQPTTGSGLPVFRTNRSFSKLRNGSDDREDAQPQIPVALAASSAPQVSEETSGSDVKASTKAEKRALRKSPLKLKVEKSSNHLEAEEKPADESLSKRTSKMNDPFYIGDRESLKERAKDLLRNLLRENNANRAVSHVSHNVSELLKNKVFSQIVKTHVSLIKNTLTNEEAKKIIESIEVKIALAFNNENAPAKTRAVFSECHQHLANKSLPKFYDEQFAQLSEMVDSKQARYVAKSMADGFVEFVKSEHSVEKIDKFFTDFDLMLNMNFANFWKLMKGGK